MIRGKQGVLEYFDQLNEATDHKAIHFALFRKGKVETGNSIYRTPDFPDWNFSKAREALSRVLDLQQFGEFTLIVNTETKVSSRGRYEVDLSISSSDMQAIAGINPAMPALSPEETDKKIQAAVIAGIEQYKATEHLKATEAKLKELEKENKELKEQAESGWNKFLGTISPFIPNILEEQGLIKTSVAGIPNSAAKPVNMNANSTKQPQGDITEEQAEEMNKRVTEAVGKIAEARPNDWLILLEKMAELIQAKPSLGDKIDMIKNFL